MRLKLFLLFSVFAAGLAAVWGAPEIDGLYESAARIYPYRVDAKEHPDFGLLHYDRIHRTTRPGGLDMFAADFPYVDSAKFNRAPGTRNSFSEDDTPESLLEEIEDCRRTYPDTVGAKSGESDWGYMRWNSGWYPSMGRFEQDRHWVLIGLYFDTFGRCYDYQFDYHYDIMPPVHMGQAGFTTYLCRQIEVKAGLLQLYSSMTRGASRQYGLQWGKRFNYVLRTNTRALYDEKFKGKGSNLNSGAEGWRWMIESYMASAAQVTMNGLRFFRDGDGTDLTPLGRVAETVNANLSLKYPNPGAQHTPIAFMQDFFTGWLHAETKKTAPGAWSRWDTTMPFYEGDHNLLNFFSVLYPDYNPRTPGNLFNPGYMVPNSYTPCGDIADVIWTDARPELLDRYNLVVLASELIADKNYLSDKLKHYVKNGGNLMLCAGQARELEWLTNEFGLKFGNPARIQAGTELVYLGGGTVTEPHAFDLYPVSGLPANAARIVSSASGDPVMVELPVGEGAVTLSLTPYGQGHESVTLPTLPYATLKHVKGVLQAKAKAVRLFDVAGSDPAASTNIMYMTTYNAKDDVYTMAVFNYADTPSEFGIRPDNGARLEDFRFVNIGDPRELIEDMAYFHNRPTDTNENPAKLNIDDSIKIATVNAKRAVVGEWTTNYALNASGHLANTNTLLGGGVAVFRFKVSCKKGIAVLPKSCYPPRPPDWYVHMPIQQLHHRLTRMPNFFTHFGGVKIDGGEFLGTSDEILQYEKGWYKVRNFNVLIDARSIADIRDLKTIINKVGILEYGARVVLNPKTRIQSLQSLAKANKAVLLVDVPSALVWIDRDNLPTSGQITDTGRIKVLNLRYPFGNNQWEQIYGDLRQLADIYGTGSVDPQAATLTGSRLAGSYPTAKSRAKRTGTRYYLTLNYIEDLPRWIADHGEILGSKISGINLDSQYLFGKTSERFQKEYAWIKARGLDVVVDISSHVNDHRDVSYIKMPLRSEGWAMLENVMQKMQACGISDLIIAPSKWDDWSAHGGDEGLKRLFELADTYKVKLHLRKTFGDAARTGFKNHPTAKKEFLLIEEAYKNPDDKEWIAGMDSDFVSLFHEYRRARHPLKDSGLDTSKLKACRGKILLLDAEYVDWTEIEADLKWIGSAAE